MPSIRSIMTLAIATALTVPMLAVAGHHSTTGDLAKKKSKIYSGGETHSFASTISDEPSTQPGKQLTLVLKTGAGVRIRGWKKSEVSVSSQHQERKCPDARIEAKHSDEGVRVESYYDGDSDTHYCSLNIDIQVPDRYDVRIESAGGSVMIENLRGTIEGKTAGGEVRMAYVRGDVSLHTGGGDIILSDCKLDGEIESGGGRVKTTRVDGAVRLEAGGTRYR